jgi:hypothetical protein
MIGSRSVVAWGPWEWEEQGEERNYYQGTMSNLLKVM